MKAAGLAAKGLAPLPPSLWKLNMAQRPGWAELDTLPYRQIIQAVILQNVYHAVKAFTSGKPSEDDKTIYAQLVKEGLVGIGVK